MSQYKILFVCLGNICRSPTAHGIMEKIVADNNLQHKIIIDSAGTSAWHVGSKPDERATKAAAKRGYNLSTQQSRRVEFEDFYEFDFILAADKSNLSDLKELAPQEAHHKIQLILEYGSSAEKEVPDPYYGGENGFEHVLNLLEDACQNLLKRLKVTHN